MESQEDDGQIEMPLSGRNTDCLHGRWSGRERGCLLGVHFCIK